MAADELGENVELFPWGLGRYDPNVLLGMSMRHNITDVVIIGKDENGGLFFTSSMAGSPECLWLIEKAKLALLNVGEE